MSKHITLFCLGLLLFTFGCRKDPYPATQNAWNIISFLKLNDPNVNYEQSSVIRNVDVISDDKVFFGGYGDPLYSTGGLFVSNDAGQSFVTSAGTWEGGSLHLFSFPSEQIGFAAFSDMVDQELLSTTNGGLTWSSQNLPIYPHGDLCFLNDTLGFLNGHITLDGGISWISQSLPQVADYEFANLTVGYAITADNQLFKTTSSGASWFLIHTFDTDSITINIKMQFLTEDLGYIVNPLGLQKTTDGGDTWETIYNNSLTSAYFKNEQIGFVTSEGNIYKTVNGGINWNWNFATELINFQDIDGRNDVVIAVGKQHGFYQMPDRNCYYVRTSTLGE